MVSKRGFVYVIESPSADDLLDGRTEGDALVRSLDLAQIPRWYSLVTDKNTLFRALGNRLIAAWNCHKVPPILHLSMHGNTDGVGLTCGDFLNWGELRQLLLPLIRDLNGGLLICMSTCFGSLGCRMAMYADNEPHFWALVGNTGSPNWPDAAVAYITFYHLFFKGFDVKTCVEIMKKSSADNRFGLHLGEETRTNWLAYWEHYNAKLKEGLQESSGYYAQLAQDLLKR